MNTDGFSMAFTGGMLIGLAAALLLLFNGRVAGISGIISRILNFEKSDLAWRFAFLAGILLSGLVLKNYFPDSFILSSDTSLWRLAIAGLLVGFGSTEGNGCTSGHGVCGISRLSKRSIVATLIFMSTGIATVLVLRLAGVLT